MFIIHYINYLIIKDIFVKMLAEAMEEAKKVEENNN